MKQKILNYQPFNEQEEKDKELLLKVIEQKDVLTRKNTIGHFTVSCWVLNQSHDKVLMCYHKIYNSWCWLGGHVDGQKDFKKVALKEFQEESGLKHVQFLKDDPFSIEVLTVNEHIKNVYKEGELVENETMTKFGNSEFADKPTNYYNLDMIISIGYRVKSQNGILFRKWATNVLKDYMLKGYAINQKRLDYLEKTVKLIDIANRIDERLEGNDAKEILKVIAGYTKALDLLDDYDHKTLKKIQGNLDTRKIEYQECISIINKLRFNEESSLFAVERNKGLESIIGNIYQSFGRTRYL